MAKGIRFTKGERELIVRAVEVYDCTPKEENLRDSLKMKLELAEMPVKKANGLTVTDAIAAFREVLGDQLLAPGFQAVGVLAQMKNRIQALGLTRADCLVIAKTAGEQWRGVIRAESLVRQADKLMSSSTAQAFAPPPRGRSPVELGEEDI